MSHVLGRVESESIRGIKKEIVECSTAKYNAVLYCTSLHCALYKPNHLITTHPCLPPHNTTTIHYNPIK